MKKLIAVVLVLTTLFLCAVPAFAQEDEHPTIYITGATTNEIVDANGNRIYPVPNEPDMMELIKETFGPCLKKLAYGLLVDNYEDYAQELHKVFYALYGSYALDKNGEASDGSVPKYNVRTAPTPKKTSNYGLMDYRLWYDWRLSPLSAADDLKEYIEIVCQATNEKKVNIIGRCYGANVIAAYLAKYSDHAVEYVDDVTYLTSSAMGIDLLSAAFAGEIKLEGESANNFINYFSQKENLFEDDMLNALVLTLVELLKQVKMLDVTGAALTKLVDKIKSDVLPILQRDTLASMPCYWSMVPRESYQKAIDLIYGDCKQEYAGMIEKLDAYHNTVQIGMEEKMLELKEKGVGFHIFVKYNFSDYPIYEGSNGQSDGMTACVRQAFGGDFAPYGKVFTNDYLDSLTDKTYLSPDLKINAATCLLPNDTWFFKNVEHNEWPNRFHSLALELMNNDISVDDGVYSAFWDDVNGELVPLEGTDEDANKKEPTVFEAFKSFCESLFNYLVKIIKDFIASKK